MDPNPYQNPTPCDNCGHPINFDVDENTIMAMKPCPMCENGGASYGPSETAIWV